RARLHLRVRRSRPPPAGVVGVHGGPGLAGGAEGHGGERAARRARRQQDLEADHLLADAVAEPAVTHDIAIVGGGIVGLATARALRERAPDARLVILEKEPRVAGHQTGHNSGVIHSGIYYKPGSYKAKLTVEGKGLMYQFCEKHGIRIERCGKVIVATTEAELPRLQTLYERGIANGVPVEPLEPARLRELEPHAAGLGGIHSPSTGVVHCVEAAPALARQLSAAG